MQAQGSYPQSIKVTITANGEDGEYALEDIPAVAWKQFIEKAKGHFPKAEDPWAAAITEFIIALGGGDGHRRSFIMTDVPESMAAAMDAKLSQVDWTWDRLHAYLLRSVSADNLKIIALQEQKQSFGTILITGVRPEVFEKLNAAHENLSVERYFGTLLLALTQGEIKIDPETEFAEPMQR